MKKQPLANKKILIYVAPIYEDLELHYPRLRLKEAGADIVIAGPKAKEVYHGKHGYPCTSDISLDQVNAKEFDAIIIPGGYAPDQLRKYPQSIENLKHFNAEKKLIAFICHAGWLPASAKLLKNIKCTSYYAIKDDLINAGANWVDEAVVIDKNFISSRNPDDLTKFCPAIIDYLSP